MAYLISNHVKVAGISACVPSNKEYTSDIYIWEGKENFLSATGIKSRRKAGMDVTSADLCFKAAEKLIDELGWNREDIDALVFVSQTPDYILPATSPILQNSLGLSQNCYTLDISLGCSGWVYAMSVLTSLLQNGTIHKGLLLAGDTILKLCSVDDKSTYPLFGDAGTCTALEYDESTTPIRYCFNSDGNGKEAIMIPHGGYREPFVSDSLVTDNCGDGILRNKLNLVLDGMSVFSFGITKAPKSVKQLAQYFNIDLSGVDLFTFHQANLMMNEMIRKKLKLPIDKVPYSLNEFANTSCASIPLTLVTREAEKLRNEKVKNIACGFGVGLSWGSIYFETEQICIPNLIEI